MPDECTSPHADSLPILQLRRQSPVGYERPICAHLLPLFAPEKTFRKRVIKVRGSK